TESRRPRSSQGVRAQRPRTAVSGEPESKLARGGLWRIRAVHEVLLHLLAPVAAQITADGTGSRCGRIRRAREGTEALDDAVSRDAERDDGTGLHELDQRLVERFALVLGVVRSEQVTVGLDQTHVDELVALRFDAAQDLAGQVAGDAIRLHQHQGLFNGGGHYCSSAWLVDGRVDDSESAAARRVALRR